MFVAGDHSVQAVPDLPDPGVEPSEFAEASELRPGE